MARDRASRRATAGWARPPARRGEARGGALMRPSGRAGRALVLGLLIASAACTGGGGGTGAQPSKTDAPASGGGAAGGGAAPSKTEPDKLTFRLGFFLAGQRLPYVAELK